MMKFNKVLACLLAVFMVVFISSCANNPQTSQNLNIQVWQNFKITLEANHSTGYVWAIEKMDNDLIRSNGSQYESSTPGLIGGGGIETWSFAALKPGKTMISFSYIRPWEKGVSPVKVKKFNIEIK